MDIALKVAAPVITFGLGRAWPRAAAEVKYRRTKRFWRPIARSAPLVLVGTHRLPSWEASSLMSVGEMRAIEELRAHFRRLYLPEFEVNFTEDLPDAKTYDSTLLCLGGPDTSPIAAQTWSAAPTSFKWGEHERHDVSIHDSTSKYPVLKPEGWQDARGRRGLAVRGGSRGQGAVTRDYGLVVKMPNPFAQRQPERWALLFAGCLGYGTWGAVRFSITETFTQHPLVLAEDAVECLLAVDVLGDAPQRIEVMDVRPLAIEP